MKTKYIEIHLAYESDEEIETILALLQEHLPKNRFQIGIEQGFNKSKEWNGFSDESD